MCVYRNNDLCLCDHCCSGKAINVKYSDYVFSALDTHHSTSMRHIVICGLPRSEIFLPHYLINGTIFKIQLWNINCEF